MQLFDSHIHLDAAEFDANRTQVLADARQAGVDGMLVPAISAASWGSIRTLCEGDNNLHPAYGCTRCSWPIIATAIWARLRSGSSQTTLARSANVDLISATPR